MLVGTEAFMKILLLAWLSAAAILPVFSGCAMEDSGDNISISGDMTTVFGIGKGSGGVSGGSRVRTGIDF